MSGLCRSTFPVAATLALSLALAPDRALAGEPQAPARGFEFAEPPPEASPGEEPSDRALRIRADEPIAPTPTLTEPPVPPAPPPVRYVDSRRPLPGTGLIVLGAFGMGASGVMMITAMTGPGWIDLDRRRAAIIGGLSLPVGLASMGMVLGGSRANDRYVKWAKRNAITPPRSGNGVVVVGAAVTMIGVAGIAGGVQTAVTDPTPSRGNWAVVGISGGITAFGLAILGSGLNLRSKFAAWERGAALQPGMMTLRGGGGLTLSGRF
ncbi:MAG: hypothetical protein R6X02_19075 [Enhygromyxa sp.]